MEPRSESTHSMVPSMRHLAPSLFVAGVLPVVGYIVLRPHVSSDGVALAAVMVFPVVEILVSRHRHGRFDPVGIIALIGIVIGLVGAVASGGDPTLLKLRESVVTGAFGVVCLGSLLMLRPLMFYLGRSFATRDDPARVAEFDLRWELPGAPARFRFVTAVWGTALVLEAVLRTVFALAWSTEVFLVVSPIVNWTFIGGLVVFTLAFSRASERRYEGLLRARDTAGEGAADAIEPPSGYM